MDLIESIKKSEISRGVALNNQLIYLFNMIEENNDSEEKFKKVTDYLEELFLANEMFEEMIDSIKRTVITFLYHIQVTYSKPVPKAEDRLQGATEVHEESKPVSREDIEREEKRKQQQQD